MAVPVAFVVYADGVRESTGLNWLVALGSLVALSLVVATVVWGARRRDRPRTAWRPGGRQADLVDLSAADSCLVRYSRTCRTGALTKRR